jgi:hypothetical protein
LAKGEKGQRGMGKTTIFFLPPSRYRIEEIGRPTVEGGRGAGDPGHGDGRDVGQNGEEVKGNSFRSSPWSGTDCGGRSTAVGGLQPGTARAALVVAMEGSGRTRNWLWRCGTRWGAGPTFYRRGKVGSVKMFELQELRWPSMAVGRKNILALTLGRRASGRRGAVDGTLRAGDRCGCGGGDQPEGRSNGGGDRWSSPVRAMEGEGATRPGCRRGPAPGMLSCRRGGAAVLQGGA